MAHRQGLNNASANIHRGAVRLGRVLYGALVHAAVRKGEVVDLRADDGATCSFNQWPSQLYQRSESMKTKRRNVDGATELGADSQLLDCNPQLHPTNCEARPWACDKREMDKARRLAKEAGAAAAEAGARAAHKAKDGARAATEAATAVAVTKAAASKQRAEAIYRGTDGLVDPHLQQKQVALKALGVCFAELSRGLRHERHRALESAKGAKETRDALTRIVEANHALRFRLQPAITSEAGLAARWEQLAGAIDAQLLSPAAVQLTAIFAEAEKVYAAYVAASPDPHPHPVPYIHPNEEVYDYVPAMLQPPYRATPPYQVYAVYVAVVNELLAATSREKRVHGIASVVNRGDEERIHDKTASAHDQVARRWLMVRVS